MSLVKKATFHLKALESTYKANLLPRLEKQTADNTAYRRVLETKGSLQTVAMSLLPGQGIKEEVHPATTQFIRVVSGSMMTRVDGIFFIGEHDTWITIAPGEKHEVRNHSDEDTLKLYTIYSPPNHAEGLVQRVQPREEAVE